MNKSTIEAGIITDIINTFKNLSQKLGRVLDSIADLGTKLVDSEQDGDSNIVTMKTPEGNIVKAKITPTSNKSKFDILFMDKSGTKIKEYKNVLDDDFDDVYYEVVLDKFGEDLNASEDDQDNTNSDESNEIAETTKFKVGFKKVISNNEEVVSYTKVFGCMNTELVLSDIHTLMSDDPFVQSIPTDTEQYYEICDDGTNISVEECCEGTLSDSYESLLNVLIPAYGDILTLHWNVYGDNFYSIHQELNEICYSLSYNIDTIAEMAIRDCNITPNFSNYMNASSLTDTSVNYTCEYVATKVQTILKNLISAIDLVYCNFSPEIHSVLDSMVNTYKTIVDYRLKQYLK